MNEQQIIRTSKLLSRVLRHDPSAIGITLDAQGWVDINSLLEQLALNRRKISRDQLEDIVETNNKRRFIISEDGLRIRANQGHSIKIDLGLTSTQPPDSLYHGTATRFLDSIREKGLLPRSRQHVHLSNDLQTATQVGSRRGKPVVLSMASGKMAEDGASFYLSENGVWLTDEVHPDYLGFPGTHPSSFSPEQAFPLNREFKPSAMPGDSGKDTGSKKWQRPRPLEGTPGRFIDSIINAASNS